MLRAKGIEADGGLQAYLNVSWPFVTVRDEHWDLESKVDSRRTQILSPYNHA
jgi:hypothetical protein